MIKTLLNEMKITSFLEPRRVERRFIGANKSSAIAFPYQDRLGVEPAIYLEAQPFELLKVLLFNKFRRGVNR